MVYRYNMLITFTKVNDLKIKNKKITRNLVFTYLHEYPEHRVFMKIVHTFRVDFKHHLNNVAKTSHTYTIVR